MNKYLMLQQSQQEKINAFPTGFAFSEEQLKEAKKKLGVTDDSELLSLGYGIFIKKADEKKYIKLLGEIAEEMLNFLRDADNFREAIAYELANHEYIITCNPKDAVEALGYTIDDLSDEQIKILKEESRKQMK